MDTIIDMIINNDIINSIISVVKFILSIPTYIINMLGSLPNEITTLLSAALIIIVALFLYRLVR